MEIWRNMVKAPCKIISFEFCIPWSGSSSITITPDSKASMRVLVASEKKPKLSRKWERMKVFLYADRKAMQSIRTKKGNPAEQIICGYLLGKVFFSYLLVVFFLPLNYPGPFFFFLLLFKTNLCIVWWLETHAPSKCHPGSIRSPADPGGGISEVPKWAKTQIPENFHRTKLIPNPY